MADPAGGVPGQILGEFSGMSHASGQLQAISDRQAVIMRQLGNTIDGLAPHFGGQAAIAMNSLGDRLITIGNQFSTKFASHSDMMKNNVALLGQKEDENVHTIRAVEGLTG